MTAETEWGPLMIFNLPLIGVSKVKNEYSFQAAQGTLRELKIIRPYDSYILSLDS